MIYPERTTDHGQATGKLYLLRLRVECTFFVISSLINYHLVCNKINTTGITSGTGTAYPSGAPEFTPA